MSEGQVLTVEEAAARLRTTPETIRRWLRSGKLRGVRPGGTKLGWRIPEAEIARVLGVDAAPAPTAGDRTSSDSDNAPGKEQ